MGSAASEDLPPPGTQPRTTAASSSSSSSFPAGAPAPRASGMDEKYLPELMAEKDSLDPSFTHALRLVNQGEGRRGGGPCRAARTFRRGSPLIRVASLAASSRGGGLGTPPSSPLRGLWGWGVTVVIPQGMGVLGRTRSGSRSGCKSGTDIPKFQLSSRDRFQATRDGHWLIYPKASCIGRLWGLGASACVGS